MANFFSKLLNSEPQKAPVCADRVTKRTSCLHRDGCGATYNNAHFVSYFDTATGTQCDRWTFDHCGCGF